MNMPLDLSNKIFPIIKYQWTSGPSINGGSWTHKEDPRLCIVIDKYRPVQYHNEKYRIRVVLGTEDLETVHAEELAEESIIFARSHAATKDQLPIFAMWRESTVAIQFKTRPDSIRRIQFRFTCISDRGQFVGFLKQISVQIDEKAIRPTTSNSIPAVPSIRHNLSRGRDDVPLPAKFESSVQSQYEPNTGTSFVPTFTPFPYEGQENFRPLTGDRMDGLTGPGSVETFIQNLPPRRELPFNRELLRPRSSTSDLPPLPKPTPTIPDAFRNTNALSENPPSARRQATRSKRGKERTNSEVYRTSITSPTGPLKLSPPRYNLRGNDSSPGTTLDLDRPTTATSDFVSSETADHARPGTARPSSAPKYGATASSSPHPDYAFVNEHATFLTSPEMQTASAHTNLADWAAMTDADRMAELDNFFIDRLEDENFIKLCEDVEGCWRRIGLGL